MQAVNRVTGDKEEELKFTEDMGNARYRITRYGQGWIQVNEERLESSFLLGPQTLVTDWEPQTIQELTASDLEQLFAIQAEVIIIGSGIKQQFPPAETWRALVQNGTGFEVMTTEAACRTYNVLLSEARRIAAAFFP